MGTIGNDGGTTAPKGGAMRGLSIKFTKNVTLEVASVSRGRGVMLSQDIYIAECISRFLSRLWLVEQEDKGELEK